MWHVTVGTSLQRSYTVLDRSVSLRGGCRIHIMAYNLWWEDYDWAHAYNLVYNLEGEDCQEFQFEGEDYDVAGQDGDHDIDVGAELLRTGVEGLASVGKAIWTAECLRAPLREISHTFRTIPLHDHQLPGDDFEFCAANALKDVDELLRQQTEREALPLPAAAVRELKVLQRHAQDVAVLANSRFVNQKIMQGHKGIPVELLLRLEASFGEALSDHALWSRLGNSKYNLFTRGLKFGERKHRRRGDRGSGRLRATAAVATVAEPVVVSSMASSVDEMGEPLRIHVLSTTPYAAASSSSASSSSACSAADSPILGEPLWLEHSTPDDSSCGIDAKIEEVLKRHGIKYNKALIDGIAKTLE